MNNDEKYIITIDGLDFSGKTTLWKSRKEGSFVQIRGILSNIAYGLKYDRDVKEMIREYNKKPFNYLIYFIKPNVNDILRNFNSRLVSLVNDSNELIKEVVSFADTYDDYKYFKKALLLLRESYNGKIEYIEVENNDLANFILETENYEEYDKNYIMNEINFVGSWIKSVSAMEDIVEKRMKEVSEFRYIVFADALSKSYYINSMLSSSGVEVNKMYDFYIEHTESTDDELYDIIEAYYGEVNEKSLINYLSNHEFDVKLSIDVAIRTSGYVDVRLEDIYNIHDYQDEIIDAKYDEIMEIVNDELQTNGDLNISVEGMR